MKTCELLDDVIAMLQELPRTSCRDQPDRRQHGLNRLPGSFPS